MFHKPKRRYLPGFVPPRPTSWLIWLCKRLIDQILENKYAITAVSTRPEEVERFSRYRGDRMVLIPNHPSVGDPAVMFKLSKVLDKDWYYLSNREQFDHWFGMFGRLLSRVGAYSIARGAMDKASFLTTKKLLVEAPNQIVIFAEGGTYSWNDQEIPLQEGLFKLLMMAAEELRDKGGDAPLWIQPVGLKYLFDERSEKLLEGALVRLESALGLDGSPPTDFRERVLRIGTKIVGVVEQGYFGKQFDSEPPHERIARVREEMLQRFADTLGVSCPPAGAGSLLERTRTLLDSFHRVSLEGVLPMTVNEERLFEEDIATMRSLRRQLERLQNWMALKEGYLAEHMSLSRRVEIVMRLEREVHKGVMINPPRKCVVRLGEPFDLRSYLPESGRSREGAVAATREAERRIHGLLTEMRL